MKVPDQLRVVREDLGSGTPDWLPRQLNVDNNFRQQVADGLNKNITFSENINCIIQTLTFQLTSAYGTSQPVLTTPIQFKNTLNRKIQGVFLMQLVKNTTNYAPIGVASPGVTINTNPGCVALQWYENSNGIIVPAISGLDYPSNNTTFLQYTITLMAV